MTVPRTIFAQSFHIFRLQNSATGRALRAVAADSTQFRPDLAAAPPHPGDDEVVSYFQAQNRNAQP